MAPGYAQMWRRAVAELARCSINVQRFDRALRALARHAKRLRKQRDAWAKTTDQVCELNQLFIVLRSERDAARAALLELALAFEWSEGEIHDGAERLGSALDAAFALVDPDGKQRVSGEGGA